MSSDREVFKTITDNPGLKAKEIAQIVGLNKKQVNRALYGDLRKDVFKDDSFRWYPKVNNNDSEPIPSEKDSHDKKLDIFNRLGSQNTEPLLLAQQNTPPFGEHIDEKNSGAVDDLVAVPESPLAIKDHEGADSEIRIADEGEPTQALLYMTT